MSKVVKADTPKPCVAHDAIESLRDAIGVKRGTVVICKYEIGFHHVDPAMQFMSRLVRQGRAPAEISQLGVPKAP